ncbi:MAG TPA: FtsW/RodA/SpoVE family cell cycle protein [Pirellulales bacterium]|nr:FtsW/RodA/SpoVE family cell cycle protein [Pirellulales bacterium]
MQLQTWISRLPWDLPLAAAGLLGLGLCGIARAAELSGSTHPYFRQQVIWIVLAGALMLACTLPSYHLLARWSYVLFAAAVGLLVAVYFFPAIHGAHRWIRLGSIGLQPSEFAKTAMVLALARWLMHRENYRRFRGLVLPLLLTLLPLVLVLREPDLGTALVFLPLFFVLLFAAGAQRRDLAALCACGLAVVPLLWSQMSLEQRSRVSSLFEQTAPGEKPSADGYQLHQAKQLLALGGVWGSIGSDDGPEDRAVYHLPESHTDFIFSVIGERFGWCGLLSVFVLHGMIVFRAGRIAQQAREPFGRLVAVGVGALFAVQVLINTGMTVGLLPVTGLSLPLVSYGGSGLLAHALALGLLWNVALRPGYEVTREPFRFAAPSDVRMPLFR